MNLSGNISAGYSADYGNLSTSDHSFNGAGNATLTGFYYNPNFLSFNIQPFYNQSRENSDFQSITASSGVTASTSIFGGSEFPGTVTYSKTFNSSGNFGVPDVANYTSRGDSQVFSVGWSALVPNLPTLSVSYQQGSNGYSLFGTNENSNSAFHSFTANSNYQWDGFNLNANYHYTTTHLDVPEIFTNQQPETSDSTSDSFSFGIGHRLPFNGSISAGASRSDISVDSSAGNYNATLDTFTGGLGFNPIAHLNVGANAQYTDNLTGALYQSLLAAGAIASESTPALSTHALSVTGYATYEVPVLNMVFSGTDDHREQTFEGSRLTSDAYTGTASYSAALWSGYLNAVLSVTHTNVSPSNISRLGLLGSLSYSRQFGRWKITGQGNYAENQQTLLISYTTSSYSYAGSVGRKFGRKSNWTATGGGSKSELLNQAGSGSFTQYYSTAFSSKWASVSAGYSKSSGNAILTATGLTATPVPVAVVTPGTVILYGGRAYSAGIGSSPIRGLTISASYSNAYSNTNTEGISSSNNKTELLNARIQYLLRKIYFQAGYLKLVQGFSGTGVPPVNASSFYVGLSRWFNFF